MSRIEPAQGNRKLVEVDVAVLPVELASLSSPHWRRKCGTQGMNVTVGTATRKSIDEHAICLMA